MRATTALASLAPLLFIGCTPGGLVRLEGFPDDPGAPEVPLEHVGGADEPGEPPLEGVEGVGDLAEELFSGDVIPTFHLTLPEESMLALHQAYEDWIYHGILFTEYVEGTFEYDGVVYDPVGVRLKGQGSALDVYDKAAFKVKFNEYSPGARFMGLECLTLNNMRYDYAMMHERVAYRIYREAGVPASRVNHAVLYVNGDLYGLYANVETPDVHMIERWFERTDGSLFEGWDVDFTADYIPYFQLEFGPDDRDNLWGVAEAMALPGQQALDSAHDHLDLAAFLRYWAVGALVGQFDAYPYTWPGDDFHVYDDPEADQLRFVPWGVDETFQHPTHPIDGVNGVIATRCLEVPTCRQAWEDEVWAVYDLAMAVDWAADFQAIQAQIAPLVLQDTMKPYANSDVEYYQWVMESMIATRASDLTALIGPP